MSESTLRAALQEAVDALAGGLWDYGPGQSEHERCDEVIERCRAVLAAPVAAQEPAGYKLVPLMPTWNQQMAAGDVDLVDWWEGVDSADRKVLQVRECSAKAIYEAMIDAAPAAIDGAPQGAGQ